MKLTKARIDALKFDGKPEEHRDDETPGLSVRVGKTAKSFIVTSRIPGGKVVRVTIGKFPGVSLQAARKAAQTTLGEIKGGANPTEQRREATRQEADEAALAITVREALAEYFKLNPALRSSTKYEYENTLTSVVNDWMDKPILEISGLQIRERHASYSSRSRANNSMKTLRALFQHVIATRELDRVNPVTRALAKRWHRIGRRKSWTEPDQQAAFLDALDNLPSHRSRNHGHFEVARDLFTFLAFTGLRLNEATQLTWKDVSLAERTITLAETKTRTEGIDEALVLPMNSVALEILQRRHAARDKKCKWVFEGEKGNSFVRVEYYKQLVRRDSSTAWTPHDSRRTFVSNGNALGISRDTLKQLVGHAGGGGDTTSGYIMADLVAMREASEKIAQRMLRQGGRADDAKVVAIAG